MNKHKVAAINFDNRLLIEQVRYIEAEQTLAGDAQAMSADFTANSDFEARLLHRAKRLSNDHDLQATLDQAARLSRQGKVIALIVAAILGALAVAYAITNSHTINIYWLLLILLGFNFISMLLWLTGVSFNMKSLTVGVLARLASWLPAYFKPKNHMLNSYTHNSNTFSSSRLNKVINNATTSTINASMQANRAWLDCNFSGDVGKWLFSKITHQLWLVYLLSGLTFLVLLLMVRQYDFVWGTTLLSDMIFITLTEILSVPLEVLGFDTPSTDQVLDTRIGAIQILTTENHTELRSHWAQFLLGSLLCFGVVPRILLWLWSALMYKKARRQFTLDYYLPYYVTLRQQLMPLASHGKIVDADIPDADIPVTDIPVVNVVAPSPVTAIKTSPRTIAETSTDTVTKADASATDTSVAKEMSATEVTTTETATMAVQQALPKETQWVAVELDDDINWPPAFVASTNDLGQVVDRDSLAAVIQNLQHNASPVIAVAVLSTRPPDRGVQRTIMRLLSSGAQKWLVLLQSHPDDTASNARLLAWYRLAEACEVPADHVVSMSLD